MPIGTYDGLDEVPKDELDDDLDLIVEGGAGLNKTPLAQVREMGYGDPYVRMDLRPNFKERVDESPKTWTSCKDETYGNFWNIQGNCFDYELVQEIIERQKAKKPVFLTYHALFDSLLNEEAVYKIPEAVKVLSELSYKKQLHIKPAELCKIVPEESYENNLEEWEESSIIRPESMNKFILLDEVGKPAVDDKYCERFMNFIEESDKEDGNFIHLLTKRIFC